MREQRVVLEDESYVALVRRQVGHVLPAELNAAPREAHASRDGVDHGGFTGALGADPKVVMPALLRNLERQINDRVRAGTMRPIKPQQFVINLISLCIFPFAARPMLSIVFGMDDDAFRRFIEQRKKELPEFFRAALRS